jgi:hypothetical protein
MQITASTQGKPGDGIGTGVALLGQAFSFLLSECVDEVLPNFRSLPLYQKIAINVAVAVIPVGLGVAGATAITDHLEKQRSTKRHR